MTAYDPISRSLLDSGGNISERSMRDPEVNADGSVDVYFGPSAQQGKTKNWIKADPAKCLFLVSRFYVPLEGTIEKNWKLEDFEPISPDFAPAA